MPKNDDMELPRFLSSRIWPKNDELFTITEAVPCPRVTMTNPLETLLGHVDSKSKGWRRSQGTSLQNCIELFQHTHDERICFKNCENPQGKQ